MNLTQDEVPELIVVSTKLESASKVIESSLPQVISISPTTELAKFHSVHLFHHCSKPFSISVESRFSKKSLSILNQRALPFSAVKATHQDRLPFVLKRKRSILISETVVHHGRSKQTSLEVIVSRMHISARVSECPSSQRCFLSPDVFITWLDYLLHNQCPSFEGTL